jgi:hypothetical protein
MAKVLGDRLQLKNRVGVRRSNFRRLKVKNSINLLNAFVAEDQIPKKATKIFDLL